MKPTSRPKVKLVVVPRADQEPNKRSEKLDITPKIQNESSFESETHCEPIDKIESKLVLLPILADEPNEKMKATLAKTWKEFVEYLKEHDKFPRHGGATKTLWRFTMDLIFCIRDETRYPNNKIFLKRELLNVIGTSVNLTNEWTFLNKYKANKICIDCDRRATNMVENWGRWRLYCRYHDREKILFDRVSKYTLAIFLERANILFKNAYDYSKTKAEDIKGKKSKVIIVCNLCTYEWKTTIDNHINERSGCPMCTQQAAWTTEIFVARARKIHGDKYDYSHLKDEDVNRAYNPILIKCNTCFYEWTTTRTTHIYGGCGCVNCANRIPWNLTRFLQRTYELYGNKYDYSLIGENDITAVKSYVSIICNECSNEWQITVGSHIHHLSKCPTCNLRCPWNIVKFMERSLEVHGKLYDYKNVKIEHIVDMNSQVPITCNICKHEWWISIDHHINHRTGCPCCNKSKGEKNIILFLKNNMIKYEIQKRLDVPLDLNNLYKPYNLADNLKKYMYDFYLPEYNCLVEFDGLQHFKFNNFFHKTHNKFVERSVVDYIKTHNLPPDIRLIRIDYKYDKYLDHILEFLLSKLSKTSDQVLYSDPDVYKWLEMPIEDAIATLNK